MLIWENAEPFCRKWLSLQDERKSLRQCEEIDRTLTDDIADNLVIDAENNLLVPFVGTLLEVTHGFIVHHQFCHSRRTKGKNN